MKSDRALSDADVSRNNNGYFVLCVVCSVKDYVQSRLSSSFNFLAAEPT